jgi:hypothetical protein
MVLLLTVLHGWIGAASWKSIGCLLLAGNILALLYARLSGVTVQFIIHECLIVRQIFTRKPSQDPAIQPPPSGD